MTLIPLPAFNDNYIWVLHDGRRALAVDPGESARLLDWLKAEGLSLDTILLTPTPQETSIYRNFIAGTTARAA